MDKQSRKYILGARRAGVAGTQAHGRCAVGGSGERQLGVLLEHVVDEEPVEIARDPEVHER